MIKYQVLWFHVTMQNPIIVEILKTCDNTRDEEAFEDNCKLTSLLFSEAFALGEMVA